MEHLGKRATRTAQWALRISAAALILISVAAGPPAAAQTFDEAWAAYERGDYTTAFRGFLGLAEQGDAHAQFNLGLMYSDGEGVPQNYIESAKWYRRAAEQGDAHAQFNLGIMYDFGQGVPQDYVESAKWYRRAAEQGDAFAQHSLGIMYSFGQGVPQDYVRAHMWLNLATSLFSTDDTDRRERARENRDAIARRLTPEALARAQRMAHEWRPRIEAQSPPPSPGVDSDGDARQRMVAIQRALARLGYDPGPADGIAGPRTRSAIRAFQAAAGLPVNGLMSDRLESAVLSAVLAAAPASSPPPRALELSSTGSGFRVSAEGHVLTNAHVVEGCAEAHMPPAGAVAVAARDEAADLALLKAPAGGSVATFRQGRGIRPGAMAVVVGYPLRGALASGANVTVGNVSALAGPGDDRRLIQITAPVQPGNSGGPVLDSAGNAVGVVVAKLDAVAMARATGDIPQNVNFAVSAGAARAFLDSEGVAYDTAPSGESLAPDEVAAKAAAFTVLVECWN